MSTLHDVGKRMLLPGPHRRLQVRLRFAVLILMLFGIAAVFARIRPAMGSATWWLGSGYFVVGIMACLALSGKLTRHGTVAVTFAGSLLVTATLWLNPAHSEIGVVLLLISSLVSASYRDAILLAHSLLVACALAGSLVLGSDVVNTAVVGLAAASMVVFLRGLTIALHDEVRRSERLQAVLELLPVLKAHGVREVVHAAVRQLVKATVSDSGMVMLCSHELQILCPAYMVFAKPVTPEEEGAWKTLEIPLGEGMTGWVAKHGQPLVSGDAEQDPRARHVPGTPVRDESVMLVPLMTNGQLYGVLRLGREGLNKYTSEDLNLLQMMAAHVSDALSRAEMEERMARTDALTGAYNRHYLNEWSQTLSDGDEEVSLLMIDCRRFKQINDRWGHLVGDWVLREAARLIKESVRSGDLVVRYGGDEFLVVLRYAGADHAGAVATRIIDRVSDWNASQAEDRPRLTLDIGVDTAVESDWVTLLERADARMFSTKRAS